MMRARMLFVIGLLMIGITGCRSAPEKYEYLLYLPEGYAEQEASWPLLLFLHGAGERGDSLALVNVHWAFHGAQDEVVPLERSQEMIEALNAAATPA